MKQFLAERVKEIISLTKEYGFKLELGPIDYIKMCVRIINAGKTVLTVHLYWIEDSQSYDLFQGVYEEWQELLRSYEPTYRSLKALDELLEVIK